MLKLDHDYSGYHVLKPFILFIFCFFCWISGLGCSFGRFLNNYCKLYPYFTLSLSFAFFFECSSRVERASSGEVRGHRESGAMVALVARTRMSVFCF
jgi:hypothetical protein